MPDMLARYEFKYLIDAHQVAAIREWARTFCEPDQYGTDGKYEVNSLYFDSMDWMLANQTIDGVRNRFKIRVRTYGWTDDDVVFCEIKGRVGTSIVKTRALLARKYINGLCRGDPPPDGGFPALKASHQDDLNRFRTLVESYDLRPRLWVGYEREAYQSTYGDGARLTFDTGLQVQPPDDTVPYVPDPTAWMPVTLDGPQIILEMKFNGAHPMWMLQLVHEFELYRISCSKYAQGAMIAGHLPWASLERGFRWTAF
ncbi:MAG: polyphosphate polymerase domain-containing protein [Myxococcota bacterium]